MQKVPDCAPLPKTGRKEIANTGETLEDYTLWHVLDFLHDKLAADDVAAAASKAA